jgi:hypothetical protein
MSKADSQEESRSFSSSARSPSINRRAGRRRYALARPSVYVRKRYRACRDPAAAHARQLKELAIWIVQVRWRLEKISPAGT